MAPIAASLDQKLLNGAYGRILKAVKAVDDGTLELPVVVVVGGMWRFKVIRASCFIPCSLSNYIDDA